jgi:alkaline phosphatase
MNKIRSKSAAIAIGLIVASSAIAGEQRSGNHSDTRNQVPQTAEQWFRAGRVAVLDRKLVNELPNILKAKNVILFVGDGMGISTVTASRILEGQLKGEDGEFNRLSFEKFPYLALSVTASANQQTSDSAPTATAMVAGIKTNDGAISVGQSITRFEPNAAVTRAKSVRTILERAEQRGMSTGVVSTARITHATPAVNYAHVSNRDWEASVTCTAAQCVLPANPADRVPDIARQLVEFPGDGLEVALGGGRTYFLANTLTDPEYPTQVGRRTDGRNLPAEWSAKPKSAYVWNRAQFDAIDANKTNRLLGLFEPSHMRYEADRVVYNDEPSLSDMTKKAIQVLQKNRKGFYLMVEGGRVDHAHHAGNAARALLDAIELSNAVKVAKEMTNDRDTLIIVTADHSHVFTLAGYPSRGNPILGLAAVDGTPLTDSLGLPYTTLSYANGPGWTGNFVRRELAASQTNSGGEGTVLASYVGGALRPNLATIDVAGLNYMQESTVPMSAETHAGEEVGIYADGPHAYLFRGVMEQNAIYHVMADALGL